MKSLDFSNSILQLPEGKTFPVEYGKLGAGILMKRRVYALLTELIENCIKDIYAFEGVILIGPPGSGKVRNYDLICCINMKHIF